MKASGNHVRRLALAGTAATAVLIVAGCTDLMPAGYPLSSTVRDCLKGHPHFVDVWGCVQTRYARGQMGDSDARLGPFLKLGDDLAGKVAAATMSDTEAKTQLSVGAANLDKM